MRKRNLASAAVVCAGVATSAYLVLIGGVIGGGGHTNTNTNTPLKIFRGHWPDTCDAPHVYRPRHRWRLEQPPSGAIADNVRALYEEMSKAILERWGPAYRESLFGPAAMSWSDGGRVLEDKMLSAVLEQGSFVAAFTGNSIAAGHDCLYEQSYPVLFNATMGRLMAAAGVGFTATNVAMGNTRTVPYSYCVDAHAGLDADLISWSFGMEIATAECDKAAAAVELFVRSSIALPRRPVVLIMDAQVDQASKLPLKRMHGRNQRFLGQCSSSAGGGDGGDGPQKKGDLMKAYRDFGLHSMFAGILVKEATQGDDRFSHENLYHGGKHFPRPMDWHPSPRGHELVADMLFMHYGRVLVGAIEGRLEKAAPGLSAAQLRDKGEKQHERPTISPADGGAGAAEESSIPPPKSKSSSGINSNSSMEALRAAVGLGWDNENVVVMVPFPSQEEKGEGEKKGDGDGDGNGYLGEGGDAGNAKKAVTHSLRQGEECSYMAMGAVLPPPEWCSDPHCEGAGSYRCANTYFPLAGDEGSRLLDMIVPKGGVKVKDMVVNHDRQSLLEKPVEGRWAVTLNEVAKIAIEYMRSAEAPEGFHKPIDTKWVLVGDAGSGPIEFEFLTTGVGVAVEAGRSPSPSLGPIEGQEGGSAGGAGRGVSASVDRQAGGGAEGAGEEDASDRSTTVDTSVWVDRRVVVCRPDFIERIDFADSSGVRFSVDGVETSVVPKDQDGLGTSSCSQLSAEILPGRHRLRVEPLRHGRPFVAVSHVLYPR